MWMAASQDAAAIWPSAICDPQMLGLDPSARAGMMASLAQGRIILPPKYYTILAWEIPWKSAWCPLRPRRTMLWSFDGGATWVTDQLFIGRKIHLFVDGDEPGFYFMAHPCPCLITQ